MDTYMLKGRCEGDAFYALLDTCFEYGDRFSLRYEDELSLESVHPLEVELAPYLIKRLTVDQWFGYYNVPGCPRAPILTQCIFQAIPVTQKLLTEYCSDIFFTREREENRYKRPLFCYQDLCFFRKQQLLLGTISHKETAFIYPPNDNFLIDLLNAGRWVEADFPPQPQLKFELYDGCSITHINSRKSGQAKELD